MLTRRGVARELDRADVLARGDPRAVGELREREGLAPGREERVEHGGRVAAAVTPLASQKPAAAAAIASEPRSMRVMR